MGLEPADGQVEVGHEDGLDDSQMLLNRGADPLDGEEVLHTHEANSIVHALQQTGQGLVASGKGQTDVKILVEYHEPGVWRGQRRRHSSPLVAQRFEDGDVMPERQAGRTSERLQLQTEANFVQIVDDGHVGGYGTQSSLRMGADQTLRLKAQERLADRGSGHAQQGGETLLTEAQVEGEISQEESGLQLAVGVSSATGPVRDQTCIQSCIHAVETYGTPIATPFPVHYGWGANS